MTAPNVALFITCLNDHFYPEVGVAVVKILEHLGCRVSVPAGQTCCGQPFYNNGYHAEARELARRMVEIFEPYDHVVTPSGSCCAMVRENFPILLKDDHAWEAACMKLAAGTWEFVEFLHKVLKVDLSQLSLPRHRTVTYHYNCHLRLLGITDQSERLLRQIGNLELRPLDKHDQCCGFGGTFAVRHPRLSTAIAKDKADCIARTGAETLVCNDAGCAMNITGLCHREGLDIRTHHIAELIAEAMGLDIAKW